jgi:hypothetical protein
MFPGNFIIFDTGDFLILADRERWFFPSLALLTSFDPPRFSEFFVMN